MTEALKAGDAVSFKTGGPNMLVENADQRRTRCIWIDDEGHVRDCHCDAHALKRLT